MAKPMNDSDKNALVEKKRILNENISRSVDKLFSAKDAWNGKPAPDIGVEKAHSIKEPIPEEAIGAMTEALNTLEKSEQMLKDIARNQSEQSKKKPSLNVPNGEEALDLSAIASSGVSRFVSHVKAPFQFGDSVKWERLKLLRKSSSIKKHLEDINSLILTDSDLSIPKAIYKLKDIYYDIDNELYEPIHKSMISGKEEGVEEGEEEELSESTLQKEVPIPQEVEENVYVNNKQEAEEKPYQYIDIEFGLRSVKQELYVLKNQLTNSSFKQFSTEWKDLVRKIQYISHLLKNDYSAAEVEYHKLIEEVNDFRNRVKNISEGFEKEANRFSRFLKRKNLEYLTPSSDHQKSLRLKLDKSINDSISNLNQLMDALEKKYVSISSLTKYLGLLFINLASVYKLISSLGEIYNSDVKIKKHKARKSGDRIKSELISSMDLNSLKRMSSYFKDKSISLINNNGE